MIYESQKQKMKKYRHVIAALISQSIGYFYRIFYAADGFECD